MANREAGIPDTPRRIPPADKQPGKRMPGFLCPAQEGPSRFFLESGETKAEIIAPTQLPVDKRNCPPKYDDQTVPGHNRTIIFPPPPAVYLGHVTSGTLWQSPQR
ncbi:hypothetical protein HGB07_03655 [Candidatus Roizmanbacteria bacterium]|nr:hypothetical protein [Candidatus Roizmanbacteria bacterium]